MRIPRLFFDLMSKKYSTAPIPNGEGIVPVKSVLGIVTAPLKERNNFPCRGDISFDWENVKLAVRQIKTRSLKVPVIFIK